MLESRNLSVFYDRHRAVENVSVTVSSGEIVVMLGANGAGKSTFLRAIAGQTPAAAGGEILMDGIDITHRPPHEIVEAGIALVPEDRGIFADLTVHENLLLGALPKRARSREAENVQRVLALFPRLAERRRQLVRTMSGGERQMVAIGRALMSAPAILMLDEPSLGLAPRLCGELFRTLTHIRQAGVGILLVEQNARRSLAIADRGYLLENGHIVGADTAAALSTNEMVKMAYLGGG
jgi:branched-chain amino acid transport system ATP-binding protein